MFLINDFMLKVCVLINKIYKIDIKVVMLYL